jgi:hypothetical protein
LIVKLDAVTTQVEKGRFVDNGDGTVTDTQKGLMWMKSDTWVVLKHLVSWMQSHEYVKKVNEEKFAGYDDWRIPNPTAARGLYNSDFSNVDVEGCEIHISSVFSPGGGYTTWTTDTRAAKSVMGYDYRSDYDFWLDKNNDGFPSAVRLVRTIQKSYDLEEGVVRFEDNKDGTISDNATGLMWKNADSYLQLDKWLSWDEAKVFVKVLNQEGFADYEDWKMPTRKETLTIYDPSSPLTDPFGDVIYLPSVFSPGAGQTSWTKTIHKTDPKLAIRFNYFDGDFKWYKKGLKSHGVRPVRVFKKIEKED